MDSILQIILTSGVAIILLGLVTFFLFKHYQKQIKADIKESQDQMLETVHQKFELEQSKATTELETRKQAIESNVKYLKEELEKYRVLINQFEKDRDRKYGNLETELKNVSQSTLNLQDTTNRLNNILGNVKLRGQWGERMAEDIIRHAGLIEGVNYTKQKKLESTNTKPDFTFLLPDKHKINMDVKFPLDNYLKMVNAKESLEKETFLKEFIRNVKDRIKEIQNRDYINPSESTLDFVLLFIPNEQVFGLIQENYPEIMDESLKQKVVLCSPFTLYAMLSIVRQAFENFRYEKDIKKIIQLFDQFTKHYDTFKSRFEGIGENIKKLEGVYDDVKNKSFKNIDTKVRHIEDYKKGKGIALTQDDDILVDLSEDTADDESVLQ